MPEGVKNILETEHNSSSGKKKSSFLPPFVPFTQSILKGIIRVEEESGSQRRAVSIRESQQPRDSDGEKKVSLSPGNSRLATN